MITEAGVEFEDPKSPGSRMLLTPEKSIESQNDIGGELTARGRGQRADHGDGWGGWCWVGVGHSSAHRQGVSSILL